MYINNYFIQATKNHSVVTDPNNPRAPVPQQFRVRIAGTPHAVTLLSHAAHPDGLDELAVAIDGSLQRFLVCSPSLSPSSTTSLEPEDRYHRPASIHIHSTSLGNHEVTTVPRYPSPLEEEDGGGQVVEKGDGGRLIYRAPMPGKVVRVVVKEGDAVGTGDVLVVMEAMKMENTITATAGGVVAGVPVKEGDVVGMKAVLVEVKVNKL